MVTIGTKRSKVRAMGLRRHEGDRALGTPAHFFPSSIRQQETRRSLANYISRTNLGMERCIDGSHTIVFTGTDGAPLRFVNRLGVAFRSRARATSADHAHDLRQPREGVAPISAA